MNETFTYQRREVDEFDRHVVGSDAIGDESAAPGREGPIVLVLVLGEQGCPSSRI
jgi:hypothetical protein